MSYSDLLEHDSVISRHLVRILPRRVVDDWELDSGTTYKTVFPYANGSAIEKVEQNGVELTRVFNPLLLPLGGWYRDFNTSTIYVDTGVDISTKTIVITYNRHFATEDLIHDYTPTSSSREVLWEGAINSLPQITHETSDIAMGFSPSFTGQISLENRDGLLLEAIGNASFNKADVFIYHLLQRRGEDPDTSNCKLIFAGYCGDIRFTDQSIGISIHSRWEIFNKTIAQASTGLSYFDDKYSTRLVYGWCENLNLKNASTLGTDIFAYRYGIDDLIGAPTNKTNNTEGRTQISDASKLKVGDLVVWRCWNDHDGFVKGDFMQVRTVSAVNTSGANYFDHDDVDRDLTTDTRIYRLAIRNVRLVDADGVTDIDTTTSPGITGAFGGFPDADGDFDQGSFNTIEVTGLSGQPVLIADMYGIEGIPDDFSGVFTSKVDSTHKTVTNPVAILYTLMRKAGVESSEIDQTSFEALHDEIDEAIGLALPYNFDEGMPTYADVITRICQTSLIRLYFNADGKWAIEQIAPMGDADYTVDDTELFQIGGSISYKDIITDIRLLYNRKGSAVINGQLFFDDSSWDVTTKSTNIGKYLHKESRQKTFHSLHLNSTDAEKLAERLAFIFSERKSRYTITAKHRFLGADIAEAMELSREKIPGKEYAPGTKRTKSAVITAKTLSMRETTFELDDQKGIEDNSEDW